MIEAALVIWALLLLARRGGGPRDAPPPIRIDVHLHVHYPDGGDGERVPDIGHADNVVPFRRRA